ncbi:hypothetical protein PZ895_00420 [Mesorhizobium sp. YIM 152430]|uniref:hypothetical protein n=1 Tax=Mesorhizobium sp. YIM 152430 TaxID=3031761 RepID=UPI0023DA40A0|nr:hypothetical protein [Mesorhizobium sp. YIM 152430]MDF1598240.1 hypothetical protein [Mesorhizobium sp. YIM 152430]
MVSFREIIENNNATFYNYRTNEKTSLRARISFFALVAVFLSIFLMGEIGDFLSAVNTVVSIIIGFSFSVMFYIATEKASLNINGDSLEQQNKKEIVEKLTKELFYNVTYFILIAISVLVLSMAILIPDAWRILLAVGDLFWSRKPPAWMDSAMMAGSIALRIAFAFCLLEAGFTFARLVGRVNFLFEEKMKSR